MLHDHIKNGDIFPPRKIDTTLQITTSSNMNEQKKNNNNNFHVKCK